MNEKYWACVPNIIRRTKRLNAEEKELYYELWEHRNAGKYCTPSNEELAKALHCSAKTISARLTSLHKKKFVNVYVNNHIHERRIYLNVPGQPSDAPMPDANEQNKLKQEFREMLQKSIVFREVEPEVLIERLKGHPFLETVQDNSTQVVLTMEQIKFLAKFARYPGKKIDCQVASFENIDYSKLIDAIETSQFLQRNDNLSLKWCLTHYADIISGTYKTSLPEQGKKNYSEREYSSGELNSLFQNIDEIEI